MKKIVAVSGGFDPIHIGHIQHFKKARELGDSLIVLLNSDEFLRKKKGFVFMHYRERKEILKSIKYIDKVIQTIDKDQTVNKTLTKLRPDIFAKGDYWNEKNLPEMANCKKLGIKVVFNVGQKIQGSSWLFYDSLRQFSEFLLKKKKGKKI